MAPDPGVTRRGFLKAVVAGAVSPLFRFLPSKPSFNYEALRDAIQKDVIRIHWVPNNILVEESRMIGIHQYYFEGIEHLVTTGHRIDTGFRKDRP